MCFFFQIHFVSDRRSVIKSTNNWTQTKGILTNVPSWCFIMLTQNGNLNTKMNWMLVYAIIIESVVYVYVYAIR